MESMNADVRVERAKRSHVYIPIAAFLYSTFKTCPQMCLVFHYHPLSQMIANIFFLMSNN